MKKINLNQSPEQKWLKDNLEELVKKSAGEILVVAGNEGFVSPSVKKALSLAKKKYPKSKPLIMEIPAEKDFLHVLIFFSLYRS